MPFGTDEKLKSYLDTNQLSREQMCLAVLAIDRRFSNVRPRHPRGGPDGARDIEAVFNGAQLVFGAVGFVNQATDSEAHKKQAQNKYSDDLEGALEQTPKPEVFVFFTNVNLTIGEKDSLIKLATSKGIAHAEIFDRERIRISLDNPDGMGIRVQYLNILMSEAEQAAFFARWGEDIQGVIADGFGRLQRSVNRMLFLQEAGMSVLRLVCVFILNREYSGNEIGHFRAFGWFQLKGPSNGVFSLLFGATDNSNRLKMDAGQSLSRENSGISRGICSAQWEHRVPEHEPETTESTATEDAYEEKYDLTSSSSSIGAESVKNIVISYNKDDFITLSLGPKLLDMDRCMFLFHLNQSLAEKVKSIRVYANDYKLLEIDTFDFAPVTVDPGVPLLFLPEELADQWVTIRSKSESFFHLRFFEQTPVRFFHADEIAHSE